MPRIIFTVTSVYAQPGTEPYAGTFDWDGPNDYYAILDEIFERGGNNPGREYFPGWQQPSVSVGDQVRFRFDDEGWAVYYTFTCAPVGWQHVGEEIDDEATVRATRERFAAADPAYGARYRDALADLARRRDEAARRRAELRSRIDARRNQ